MRWTRLGQTMNGGLVRRWFWRCLTTLWLLGFTIASPAASSPVADAAERGDLTAIREAIAQGVHLDTPQADGMTALLWAVERDDSPMVEALLRAGAVAGRTNRFGVPPLSLACRNGSPVVVKLLLKHGADPRVTLRGGETALMTAARTGVPEVVSALLQAGAPVNARERRGQTALMWAAAEGHGAVVDLLLEAGADIASVCPDSGFNAFFFAVREGRTDVVRRLLKAGVDVNAAMDPRKPTGKGPAKGTSALILAIENGHFDLALALLQAGADPNDQRSGFAPLHVLSWARKPNRGEDDGAPPPQTTGTLGSLGLARRLVEHGAQVNLRLAKGTGAPGRFHRQGATPFLMASATADVPFMRLLLELGAEPGVGNLDGCTPLIAACGNVVGSDAANEKAGEEPEVLETAKLLLDLGADVNAVDANGETAMHAAAYKNLPKVVRFLADRGADARVWNRTNRYGWTPVMIAEGHRPGNFKPSAETLAALQEVLAAAPAPSQRPAPSDGGKAATREPRS